MHRPGWHPQAQAGYSPQPQHGYPQPHHPQHGYPHPQPRPYVGPQWAQPGPHRPLPPKKSGGCLVAALAVVGVMVVLLGGLLLLIVVGVGAAASGEDDDTIVDLPEDRPKLPSKDAATFKGDTTTQAAWAGGVCADYSKERDRTQYYATRNVGSARVLRGRVAMLHLRLAGPSMRWTKSGELNVARAGYLSQQYVASESKRYGVNDLKLEVIPWAVKSDYTLPALATNANAKLSDETMRFIRDSSKTAVEAALGARLEKVVEDFKKDGFSEVGFLVYFPIKTVARDFAFSAYRGDDDRAEVAFLFSPTTDFPHFAVTVTHEGLHLFGADDLYRMRSVDKTDAHDIMGEYCTGFKPARVNDATAYAIGWTDKAPVRPYKITVR